MALLVCRARMTTGARRLRVLAQHVTRSESSASSTSDEYDLVVLGGGSGGLACSKEAASLGKKVAVLDFVAPSPQGSVWGLGGTCVNVGCIPKKLMHQASLLGQSIQDAEYYGWSGNNKHIHSWQDLVSAVTNHIRSLNWGHRVKLNEKGVEYLNARGSLTDSHTVQATLKDGSTRELKSRYIVVAVGGRPHYPDIPGAVELGISSDDLFSLNQPPGRTLVIGASYVALECAGFLRGLGYSTSLMMRSIPLRGFDQELAGLVVDHMEKEGVEVIRKCIPTAVRKGADSLTVSYKSLDTGLEQMGQFDTVLFATGRRAATASLGLSSVGVKVDSSGRIVVDERDSSTAENVYAIGDVAAGRPELTPVAIQAGKLLAQRLFNGSKQLMDYSMVPTTVFTPLEFGSVGMSEESAIAQYGDDSIEVYHSYYKPLEYYLPQKDASQCYIKMVCIGEKVVGMHLTGPNAGEMLQGFAVALKCGASLSDVQGTVGIHPTSAEEVVKLRITKRSGEDPSVTAC